MGKRNFIIKVDHTKPIDKWENLSYTIKWQSNYYKKTKTFKKIYETENGCYNNRVNNINVNKFLSALCIFDLGNVGQ